MKVKAPFKGRRRSSIQKKRFWRIYYKDKNVFGQLNQNLICITAISLNSNSNSSSLLRRRNLCG